MSEKIITGGGWAEVLLRDKPGKFRSLSDLQEKDYRQCGSAIPLKELPSLRDLLVMVLAGNYDGLDRAFQHGDVLQIVTQAGAVRSYVAVHLPTLKTSGEGGSYRVEIAPGDSHGLVLLPQRFASFWARQKYPHEFD